MTLSAWAARWIPPHQLAAALADLQRVIQPPAYDPPAGLYSEAGAQVAVRLAASREGILNWRNNKGALFSPAGALVRFGLANDTKEMSKKIRSADLIGIRPLVITQAHVGSIVGQFWSREVKAPGWKLPARPDAHETAQLRWAELVLSRGGDAAFTTGAVTK